MSMMLAAASGLLTPNNRPLKAQGAMAVIFCHVSSVISLGCVTVKAVESDIVLYLKLQHLGRRVFVFYPLHAAKFWNLYAAPNMNHNAFCERKAIAKIGEGDY
jgi:hypothetical protein